MIQSHIIDEIEKKAHSMEYSVWTIGVTDDPKTRRAKHSDEGENTRYWSERKADSESHARFNEK